MKKLIALAVLTLLPISAHSETITSVYSDLDITKCKTISVSEEDGGGSWRCKGIKGYNVIYSEGDLRGTVAFGPAAENQCSSAQSFGKFNSPGTKIEWRMKSGKPIATILRWFTDNGEEDGKQNWLVVTKLNGDEACRTAFVDTKTPNANAVAKQKADNSKNFNCSKDLPEVISTPMLKADDFASGSPCVE